MDSKYYMAIDIGGTNIKYAVVDGEAQLIEKGKITTPKEGIEKLISLLGDVTRKFEAKHKFEGIALSCPGAVNNNTGFIAGASAVPCIHGPNIRELLERETGLRVSLENDANCAALAEVWKGAAKDAADVLFVVCGTGIGGAIIKDKKLHTGKHLFGGEFGYMIMGRDYKNLSFNIWSAIASTQAIVVNAAKLKKIPEDKLDGEKVFTLAEQGDEACIKAVDEGIMSLAEGIFSLQHMFDPEMILLGGAISNREDIIYEINKRLHILMDNIKEARLFPRIEKCAFSNDANIIGAVYNFMNTFCV